MLGSQTEPKMPARMGKFTKHSGRRITTAPGPAATTGGLGGGGGGDRKDREESVRNRTKFSANASVEEIDKLLEADALALLNIKKDISTSQEMELMKLKESIMFVKKEYDGQLISNNIKEKEYQSLVDKYTCLLNVDKADSQGIRKSNLTMQSLTEQTNAVLDDLAAEQRTIKMQTLMIKRLDSEIARCRVDTAKALVSLDTAKHDLVLAEAALAANRQELSDEETAYEKLVETLKLRKDQREAKIAMLTSLSMEGESSVLKLQSSLQETERRTAALRSRKSSTRGRQGTAKSAGDMIEEIDGDEDDLMAIARRITVAQLREAVQRYLSQSQRVEKLTAQDQELRQSLAHAVKKKKDLSDHLTATQYKIQQLASSRQIYQEVDLKDSALAATSKECEEAQERDFRLRLSLEELKQSIPRFLTKVTKVVHPKPAENQLGDAILKLEDEITKLIKIIGVALLKDASADDLAMMSQQGGAGGSSSNQTNGSNGEANSEFGRLQRLPGFSRMQRQLFFNLMTARPDISEQNIRIGQRPGKPNAQRPNDGAPGASPRAKRVTLTTQLSASSFNSANSDFANTPGTGLHYNPEEIQLDRGTIKSISKLIYERDHSKLFKPPEKSL